MKLSKDLIHAASLYTRYPIVARALGLAAASASASREQRYLAYKLHPLLTRKAGAHASREFACAKGQATCSK